MLTEEEKKKRWHKIMDNPPNQKICTKWMGKYFCMGEKKYVIHEKGLESSKEHEWERE